MTLTAKQLEDRNKGIGSSEMAAIVGLNPFQNQHDVWRLKMGLEPPFEGNAATELGTKLEPALLDLAESEIGERVVKGSASTFVEKQDKILRANIDGFVGKAKRGNPIVECKTTGMQDGWGEPGTDQVPPHVVIQVHHQMVCAESDFAYVARLGPPASGHRWEFSLYHVPINPEIAHTLRERAKAWWEKYVVGKTEPPFTPTDATVRWFENLDREDDKEAEVDDGLIAAYVRGQEMEAAGKELKKDARTRLLAAANGASKLCGDGRYVKLSHVNGRAGFNTKLFKQHHPELHEQYATVGSGHTRLYVREIKETQ